MEERIIKKNKHVVNNSQLKQATLKVEKIIEGEFEISQDLEKAMIYGAVCLNNKLVEGVKTDEDIKAVKQMFKERRIVMLTDHTQMPKRYLK